MDNMIRYIFGSLKNTDQAINEIAKKLRRQNRLNRRFAIYSLATTAILYISEKRHKEEKELLEEKFDAQAQLIEKLNSDIMQLKTLKGEHQM